MYSFISSNGIKAMFLTSGNSTYDAACIYEQYPDVIQDNLPNKHLTIILNNIHNYKFEMNVKYHLYIIRNNIELYFDENTYVVKCYRPVFHNISQQTYKKLFDNNTVILVPDDEEYRISLDNYDYNYVTESEESVSSPVKSKLESDEESDEDSEEASGNETD